ncbi:hypothetical protein RHSIM_Rhsim03G0194000 [Rhododendron simsii]|uniref:Uncharacterized protein n=1 Tax=Rhododendron simsii TaxID=118357 RepID=A0A834HAR7_RHOSS|nr:hypothetical protein RHSIM_Rhsim03G0194000 [Rhododendron simsii]
MEDTIILYPSPGMGHLVPMVELGKLILNHNPSFSIIILITTAPFDTGSTSSYIKRVTVATPSVHFHHLPTISPPSTTSSDNIAALTFELPRLYNSNLHHALQTMISQKSRPTASIIDLFCNSSFEVFTSLDIPTYYFCTSSASSLSALLSLPKTHQILLEKNKDPNTSIEFPGVPPIPTPDLPGPFLDTEGIAYKSFFGTAINMVKSAGILTNTCQAFEPRAVKAISDGLCTPNLPTPSVYCIGPIVANSDEDHEHECLRWLDSQPSRSVVFLCFGSMGLFKAEQLTEMAIGVLLVEEMKVALALEQSESRFVSADELEKRVRELMDSVSGEGVRERVRAMRDCAKAARGDGGSSRVALAENSALEAVCAGVPMVAWPLYAEQRLNRVLLVKEMKLALWMNESESGFVTAEEKRVTELMDSEEGKAARDRVKAASEDTREAMSEGGSSRVVLAG